MITTAENVVIIKGNQYKYCYDGHTQETKYLGPVGNSPALSEQEFFDILRVSDKNKLDPYLDKDWSIEDIDIKIGSRLSRAPWVPIPGGMKERVILLVPRKELEDEALRAGLVANVKDINNVVYLYSMTKWINIKHQKREKGMLQSDLIINMDIVIKNLNLT